MHPLWPYSESFDRWRVRSNGRRANGFIMSGRGDGRAAGAFLERSRNFGRKRWWLGGVQVKMKPMVDHPRGVPGRSGAAEHVAMCESFIEDQPLGAGEYRILAGTYTKPGESVTVYRLQPTAMPKASIPAKKWIRDK